MSRAIFWFRQDLRINDHQALEALCSQYDEILPLYINDVNHQSLGSAQKWWLHHSLLSLNKSLQAHDLSLCLKQGDALLILEELIDTLKIDAIYWSRRYEPLLIERDKSIKQTLKNKGIDVRSYNTSLLNEPWQITNKSNEYFKVFTPYWKTCLQHINIDNISKVSKWPTLIKADSEALDDFNLCPKNPDWASQFAHFWQPGEQGAWDKYHQFLDKHLAVYKGGRDIPAQEHTSKLSPHLHFGEISVNAIWIEVQKIMASNPSINRSAEHFLSELGWREFSYHLLYHYPSLPKENFKKDFNAFPWHDDDNALACWQKGQTGYPIIDAGMRELWQTGYMHNRVRMIVASFLTKDLFIDWRQGADWFFDTLLDADLANNSASWQWVAGCGADAAPYFRIFNPVLQGEKFDPDGAYVKRWVPELQQVDKKYIHQPWTAPLGQRGKNYPKPVVDHQQARNQALMYYQNLKNT